MCLFEREPSTPCSQGGTSEQYRRWIRNHPEHVGIRSLNPLLVWRSGANGNLSSHTGRPDEDQPTRTVCTAACRSVGGDRLCRRAFRVGAQWRTHARAVLRATSARCRSFPGSVRTRSPAGPLDALALFGSAHRRVTRSIASALSRRSALATSRRRAALVWADRPSWEALEGLRHRWDARGGPKARLASQ